MSNNEHPWCQFDPQFRLLVVRAAARSVMRVNHGNEEHYHDSENEPANFRRSSPSQIGQDDKGSGRADGRTPLDHLEANEAGEANN
jgi:hypothetical protein